MRESIMRALTAYFSHYFAKRVSEKAREAERRRRKKEDWRHIYAERKRKRETREALYNKRARTFRRLFALRFHRKPALPRPLIIPKFRERARESMTARQHLCVAYMGNTCRAY